LSIGEAAVDGVDLAVGQGKAKSPTFFGVDSAKVSLAVEWILVGTVRAGHATAEEAGGKGDTGHGLPFAVKR
jgi:hypothetical protein